MVDHFEIAETNESQSLFCSFHSSNHIYSRRDNSIIQVSLFSTYYNFCYYSDLNIYTALFISILCVRVCVSEIEGNNRGCLFTYCLSTHRTHSLPQVTPSLPHMGSRFRGHASSSRSWQAGCRQEGYRRHRGDTHQIVLGLASYGRVSCAPQIRPLGRDSTPLVEPEPTLIPRNYEGLLLTPINPLHIHICITTVIQKM